MLEQPQLCETVAALRAALRGVAGLALCRRWATSTKGTCS
jgi:hypothetical protein